MGILDKLRLFKAFQKAKESLMDVPVGTMVKSKTLWSLVGLCLLTSWNIVWDALWPVLPDAFQTGLQAIQGVVPNKYQPVIAFLLMCVGFWGRLRPKQNFQTKGDS
jgi:hypothetical protein